MKRVTDTSRDAIAEITRTLPAREAAVFDALRRLCARGVLPTAYELLMFMQGEQATALDLNTVRPRLTALAAAGKVQKSGKRQCEVTGRRVYVWTIAAQPRELDARIEQRPPATQTEIVF